MSKQGFVYIITNFYNTVVYIGVTSNLTKRIWEHKNGHYPNSFSAKYKLNKLIYFEIFDEIKDAIAREKQMKNYSRKKKEDLINKDNKIWVDISRDWCEN